MVPLLGGLNFLPGKMRVPFSTPAAHVHRRFLPPRLLWTLWMCACGDRMFNSGSPEVPVVPAKAWLGVSYVSPSSHFRGECGWNRGARTAFALSPHETVLLCPDCAWEWVLLVQACPRRPCVARPAEELARHIRSAQTLTQPGAVELTACVGGSASWAKVRKWLLHTVRDRSCSKDEIFLLCRHKLSQVLMLDFFLPFLSKSCGLSVARGTLPSPPGKVFSSWGRVSG